MVVDFPRYMEPAARRLLGEPNRALSSKSELRFGTNGSLSVDLRKGTYFDHESKTGGGVIDLITRETGHANGAAVDWLHENVCVEIRKPGGGGESIESTYDYSDDHARLVSQVVRFRLEDGSKTFCQRRPNGTGGWIWNVKGVDPIPYLLPAIIDSDPDREVFIVEGEKDADKLAGLGLIATCNAGGAGKWRRELSVHLAGRDVIIIPDNDKPGAAHGEQVARSIHGIASSVRVVNLPGLPAKGDVSDWLDGGGTIDALRKIVDRTARWEFGDATVAVSSTIEATPYAWVPGDRIPRREWLYDRHLIRGFASGTVAPGGTGKTALVVAEALALVTGPSRQKRYQRPLERLALQS